MRMFAKKIYMETGYYALTTTNKFLGGLAFATLLWGASEGMPVLMVVSVICLAILFKNNMRARNMRNTIILTVLHFLLGMFSVIAWIGKTTNAIMFGHTTQSSSSQSYEQQWASEKAKKDEGFFSREQDMEARAMGFRDAEEADLNNIDMGGKYYKN